MAKANDEKLAVLKELIEAGEVTPVVDRTCARLRPAGAEATRSVTRAIGRRLGLTCAAVVALAVDAPAVLAFA